MNDIGFKAGAVCLDEAARNPHARAASFDAHDFASPTLLTASNTNLQNGT